MNCDVVQKMLSDTRNALKCNSQDITRRFFTRLGRPSVWPNLLTVSEGCPSQVVRRNTHIISFQKQCTQIWGEAVHAAQSTKPAEKPPAVAELSPALLIAGLSPAVLAKLPLTVVAAVSQASMQRTTMGQQQASSYGPAADLFYNEER